jgi:hypothetical protein
MASTVTRSIWAAMAGKCVLFRVNTGVGWVTGGGQVQRRPDGSVVVPYGRPVSIGLTMLDGKPLNGTSDLLGFTAVKITPAMVGRTLPVFTGFEVKEGTDQLRPDQNHFIAMVLRAGGIAGMTRSPEDALAIYEKFLLQFREKVE